MEPAHKNLCSLHKIWVVLDREFENVSELIHEFTTGLLKFQYSLGARMEGQKFLDLQRKWKQAIVDLEEVGALASLNNLVIIEDINCNLLGIFYRNM